MKQDSLLRSILYNLIKEAVYYLPSYTLIYLGDYKTGGLRVVFF